MLSYLPGTVQSLGDAPLGACILFSFHQKAKLGFVVELPGDRLGVLDLDAEANDGGKHPAVYALEHLSRERAFVYQEARIAPVVDRSTISFGCHNNGSATKALYLSGDELIVQASHRHHAMRINLITGTLTQADIAYGMHCTKWRIEAPNAEGDYRTLVEFTA